MLNKMRAKLGKLWFTIALVLAALVVVGGSVGVYAAWSQTKQAATTAMVLGTFQVENLVCDEGIAGEWTECRATIANSFNAPIYVQATGSTLTVDQGGEYYGDMSVGTVASLNGSQEAAVAPGASAEVVARYRSGSAPEGTVLNLVMEITATD